jgi:transposase-like protein
LIILCVHWYLRYKLSLRDLVEMMAERGLSLAHTTILRWVQRYTPEFVKRWDRFATPVGQSWRVDETYLKIVAGGSIFTGRLIGPARRWISCVAQSAT